MLEPHGTDLLYANVKHGDSEHEGNDERWTSNHRKDHGPAGSLTRAVFVLLCSFRLNAFLNYAK